MFPLYPEDNGLFAPLLLNIIELQPGEAMFLYARTTHAYIEGVGLEVMANSDNVLRAGLTNKHIDIAELFLLQPNIHNNEFCYPIPVDDFDFSLYLIDNQLTTIANNSATILFCVEGKISITSEKIKLPRSYLGNPYLYLHPKDKLCLMEKVNWPEFLIISKN